MIDIRGTFTSAKIFTENVEESALLQIEKLLEQETFKDCQIRIMPDVHSGKGCVIGFTSKLKDKVIPNIVGVDIGCGMVCVNIGKKDINLAKLDSFIHESIPSGFSVNGKVLNNFNLENLRCYEHLTNIDRILLSLGSLGSGNHFIELNEDEEGNKFIVIHSGSRNLGKQVASYYQNLAIKKLSRPIELDIKRRKLIKELTESGRQSEIQESIENLKKEYLPLASEDLAYLEGEDFEAYLNDMEICKEYASVNRKLMAIKLLDFLGIEKEESYFETVHNYIDIKDRIIRKGAVSAKKGETLLIPINMRDGSLLCVGKGNEDWNCSAPHGAGRLMSRNSAKKNFTIDEFKESMDGIYTSCIGEETLDESPMSYKPMDEIIGNIGDTVEIIKVLKPIYNFKAK